jgi:uncharacterized membrane protein HdeD (DUF308 family)
VRARANKEAIMAKTLSEAKVSVGWSIGLSVVMLLAGLLAIAVPQAAGLSVSLVVAWLLLFSGATHFLFAWHTRGAGGVLYEVLLGIVYAFIGGYILLHPIAGLASLTLAIAFYLLIEGVLEVVLSLQLRPMPGAGWLLLDGVITLILAVMIWRTWPSSSAWVIGTLVGVSMLFSGVSRLVLSLAVRHDLGSMNRHLGASA